MEEFIITENLRKDLRTIILASKQNVATTEEVIKILNQLQQLKPVSKEESPQV